MMEADALPLNDWTEIQAQISAVKMAEGVSATWLIKYRPGFGHTVRPAPGSVIAAIGSASDESEPDYFFHWLRDSAAVMDAGLILIADAVADVAWRRYFAEFVQFSLDLSRISGKRLSHTTAEREAHTLPKLRQFLRSDAELAGIDGFTAVLGDVRYNPDGTLDMLKWSRPQHDGPAARALTCLRFLAADAVAPDSIDATHALVRIDLDYTLATAGQPCIDLWEEENARHYYTCILQCEALNQGAAWAQARGDAAYATALAEAGSRMEQALDGFWSQERGFLLSRIMAEGATTAKELDLAVILGVLHSGRRKGPHSIADPRVAATLHKLEETFLEDYELNRKTGAGLALGRYRGDVYFSGGAYFFCTFGAAEFYYKLATQTGEHAMVSRGDAILAMARRSIPDTGEISEQFDQTTGEQTSAKSLTWSYASYLTCWHARRVALGMWRERRMDMADLA